MNFGKLMSLIAQNNINPDEIFGLVERIKSSNLQDEANLRKIIQDVSKIAGKKVDKHKEDELVKKILKDGINDDVFDLL